MRLSKKGFNNVLIFSILTLIFIFNFGKQLLPDSESKDQTIIDSALTIVEIKTPDFTIKRLGRSWSQEPNHGLSEQQLSKVVQNWQSMPLPVYDAPIETISPYIISVYIANKDQPMIIKLIQQGNDYVLQTSDQTVLFLKGDQLSLFLGR